MIIKNKIKLKGKLIKVLLLFRIYVKLEFYMFYVLICYFNGMWYFNKWDYIGNIVKNVYFFNVYFLIFLIILVYDKGWYLIYRSYFLIRLELYLNNRFFNKNLYM